MTMHRGNHDDPHTVVTEERYIPAKDAGIQLYLRNKRPAGVTAFGAERTVLLVHGSSYPAHTAFDLPLDGMSWMDYMAGRGFDVHCLDLRGFGRSTRPPEMDRAAAAAEPVVDTSTALRDVAAAVEHILASRSIDRLCLIGWSWGATLVGAYTAEHGERVARLVLYAPQWLRDTPHPGGRLHAPGRLPHHHGGGRPATLAVRRAGGPAGRAGAAGVVRRLGQRDLRLRRRGRDAGTAGHPGSERKHRGLHDLLVLRASALRPRAHPLPHPGGGRRLGRRHPGRDGRTGVPGVGSGLPTPHGGHRRRHPHRPSGAEPHATVS
ncbi:protein of unknown function (plasmid) [Azospirillum baldaniorum]|uniref:AB hydrolase-1 domain-containing protein n=1 Tax=Azospirillum baldaniorum TaxID=1064539 RepID=A0A9P1JYQ5_9PROT|nr:protein of unknown function [Azospirillum baldaniorum]